MSSSFSNSSSTDGSTVPLATNNPTELTGLCACSGLVIGKAFPFSSKPLSFAENSDNPIKEQQEFDKAITILTTQLEHTISTEKNSVSGDILNTHLLLLKDPLLLGDTRKFIKQGKTASFAFNMAIRHSIDILKSTNNALLIERIADLKDLRRKVLLQLTGITHQLPDVPQDSILVAEELLPSDISSLPEQVVGVLLASGSPTSHVSILLRNKGIPAIVGASEQVLAIKKDDTILLDADEARAILNPTDKQQRLFVQKKKQVTLANQLALAQAKAPAYTKDNQLIAVKGNISNLKEAQRAEQSGSDGLGLVRTEFLLQTYTFIPSEEEQLALYQEVLNAASGKQVTFRLLDAGGDKPIAFINIAPEKNPIAGIRGIRAFKKNEKFFRQQIRALLRLTPITNVRLMLPMVTFVQEVEFFKQLILQEAQNLGITQLPQLGIMVEVPATALLANELAKHIDFFSIGTNDLTQYTLAIDRGHKELSYLADHLNPAVLQLIALSCKGAKSHKRTVTVCGAMAGDLTALAVLLGLGVSELSVGASSVARVKALVRQLDIAQCQLIAKEALQVSSAAEVRNLIKTKLAI